MTPYDLPPVNATLNAISALLLIGGYLAIKRRRFRLHVALMLAAISMTLLFLTSYLIYHYHVPSNPFPLYTQPLRATYYIILFTHIVMAAILLPMIVFVVSGALRRRWRLHRTIARPTFWIWLYVSITGVLVYTMLYQLPGWLSATR